MKPKVWVEISKSALLHNLGQFLSLLSPGARFMAVVKSNAYGHGLVQIVSSLRDDNIWFGVDSLDEAKIVRQIARQNPVLVLGYTQNARLMEAAKIGARITVYNWETVKALQKLSMKKLYVHLKVETGTNRQGISEDEAAKMIKELDKIKGVKIEGISTHFANSEDICSNYALTQFSRYNRVIERIKGVGRDGFLRHTACTAATLLYPQTQQDLVRVGIGLYGLYPSTGIGLKVNLKPVLSWKTIVAQVKKIKKSSSIGYDLIERVARDSRIAVLPVGYWDGYDRGLSCVGYVLINGHRCKVLGRVCMNMMMVDITSAGIVRPEDEVVLLGRQGRGEISVEEIAQKINTINYEVVTRINPQLPRIIVR